MKPLGHHGHWRQAFWQDYRGIRLKQGRGLTKGCLRLRRTGTHIQSYTHIYIFIIIYIYHTGKVSTLGFHNLTKLPSLLPQNIAVVGLPYTMVYPNLFQKSSIYDSSLESQCYFYIICIIDIQVIIGNIVNHHK